MPDTDVKLYQKPRGLKRLAASVCYHVYYKRILKTAAEMGWFTDGGRLLTRLSDKESKMFEAMVGEYEAKNAIPLPVMKILDNRNKGPQMKFKACHRSESEYPFRPSLVELTNSYQEKVFIPTWVYATMKERHPNEEWHMTAWNKAEDLPLILVNNGGYIKGMVMPFNV